MSAVLTHDQRRSDESLMIRPLIIARRPISLMNWTAALAAMDIAGVALIGVFGFRLFAFWTPHNISHLSVALIAFIPGWVLTAWAQDLYARRVLLAGPWVHSLRGVTTCVFAFGIVLILLYASHWISHIRRDWLLTWWVGSSLWFGAIRLVWTCWLRASLSRGNCLERALVVSGSSQHARRWSDDIEKGSRGQVAVVGAVTMPGLPNGAPMDWIEEAVRDGAVDQVIIAGFEKAKEQSEKLLARLTQFAVNVTFIPDLDAFHVPAQRVDCIGALAAVGLASRPLTLFATTLKRAEDLLLTCLFGIVAIPIAIVVAVAIKVESPGPIIFGQWRAGYHDKPIMVWKFRTMHHQARDEGSVVQTSRQDKRVTRVGRILRRLSLDELPQFLNVLMGEMSIVGPRPHALQMKVLGQPLTQILEHYTARHRLKPGITGWAQVNGCRGEVETYEKLSRRVTLDCYYIDHWSLSFDLWIVLRTMMLLLFDSNAY